MTTMEAPICFVMNLGRNAPEEPLASQTDSATIHVINILKLMLVLRYFPGNITLNLKLNLSNQKSNQGKCIVGDLKQGKEFQILFRVEPFFSNSSDPCNETEKTTGVQRAYVTGYQVQLDTELDFFFCMKKKKFQLV